MIGRLNQLYNNARDHFRRRHLDDEFIRWLRYANPGMLDRGNVWSLDFVMRNLPSSDPLIEIGSFAGLSANVICHLLLKHGRDNVFFTCDNWDVTGQQASRCIDGSAIAFPDYAEFVKASYIRNVSFFSPRNRPHTIEAESTVFFERWGRGDSVTDVFGRSVFLGGPISFCYVDAVHSREAVRRQFESIDRYLVSGGFILFDDSSDGGPFDLKHLMQEIARSGCYELAHQNPNYLFRKR